MSWVLILFITLGTSFAGIPVLGITTNDEVISGEISEKDYSETLRVLKTTMDEKVVRSLSAPAAGETHWQMNKFSLGLGLSGEVGAGPFKYSGVLKHRFIYSR